MDNLREKRNRLKEKRHFPRVKRAVTLQYRVREVPHTGGLQINVQPEVDISRTKDISEEGVFFTSGWPISKQSILEIKLRIPIHPESVFLEGEVVTSIRNAKYAIYDIRVKFINLQQGEREILRNYVQLFLGVESEKP